MRPTPSPILASRLVRRLAAAALLALSAGCGSQQLETGYTYQALNSTPTQRRAYYAGPFSPEAREAMRSGNDVAPERRPRPGM